MWRGWLIVLLLPLCFLEAKGQATATAKPEAVCPNGSAILSAFPTGGSGDYTYRWEPQNLIDGDNTQYEVSTLELSETTTFTCTVTDETGANYVCDVSVTVKTPPIAYMGDDQYVPYNTAVTFTATDAGEGAEYHWEPEDMIAEGQGTTTVTTVRLTAMHQFYLTVWKNGCPNLHYVNVFVGEQLQAIASAEPSVICDGATTVLSAQAVNGTGHYDYQWEPAELIDGDNHQATVTTKPLTDVPNMDFTCTVSDGNQTFSAVTQIIVYQRPMAMISPQGGTSNICEGTSLTLMASPSEGPWSYLWSTGETTPSITVQPTDPTTNYWLKVSSLQTESCEEQTSIAVHTIAINAEIIGYQEVFNASDLWPGLYNYSVVEHTGFNLGEVEWECDQPDWIVTKIDNSSCMLWVKSVGTAVLTAKPANVLGCDDALSIVINATEYVEADIPVAKLFPNPAHEDVTVMASNIMSVKVFDIYGQVLKNVQSNPIDTVVFTVQDLSDGFYLVEIVTTKETIFKRIVVAK